MGFVKKFRCFTWVPQCFMVFGGVSKVGFHIVSYS